MLSHHPTDGKHKVKARNLMRGAGYKLNHGGKAYSEAHDDQKQDPKLIESSVGGHDPKSMNHGRNYSNLKTLKAGGIASGEKSHHRSDKTPRKAKAGGKQAHTKINIMVAPGKSGGGMPSPGGMPLPPIAPIGAAPRPPMAPGTAPPMARPGMMPPPVAKHGGKLKSGGRAIGRYDDGAGSGEGRLEKVKNYKKNVKKD